MRFGRRVVALPPLSIPNRQISFIIKLMSIYLDNAATSFPKPEAVYRAVDRALRETGGNPGRGGHRFALDALRLVLDTREAVAGLFGIADSSRVVFTGNATEAINLALFGLLKPGERVVTTSMEHNAVARPLRALQERGVQVVKVQADARGLVDPDDLRRSCLEETTRLLVLGHGSNVTGAIQPLAEIGPWCREQGILLLVDAAQTAGLVDLPVESLGIDLLAASGHKGLLGPAGTGFLYVRPGLQLQPLIYGGTGANSVSDLPPEELPERFESGTLNTPGLAGLKAGIEFIQGEGLARIRAREADLVGRLLRGLRQIPGVILYGPEGEAAHGGAVSFNLAGADPTEVGFFLEREYGVCGRIGLHCAPDAHRTIGSFPRGTLRLSPGYFTSDAEIETALAAVTELAARNSR